MLVCSPNGAIVEHFVDLSPTALLELVLQDMICNETSQPTKKRCSGEQNFERGTSQLTAQQLDAHQILAWVWKGWHLTVQVGVLPEIVCQPQEAAFVHSTGTLNSDICRICRICALVTRCADQPLSRAPQTVGKKMSTDTSSREISDGREDQKFGVPPDVDHVTLTNNRSFVS